MTPGKSTSNSAIDFITSDVGPAVVPASRSPDRLIFPLKKGDSVEPGPKAGSPPGFFQFQHMGWWSHGQAVNLEEAV